VEEDDGAAATLQAAADRALLREPTSKDSNVSVENYLASVVQTDHEAKFSLCAERVLFFGICS
jgi:hypothetical protein